MPNVLLGEKYNRLTIVKDLGRLRGGRTVVVKCDCGTEKEILLTKVTRGITKSCGCLIKEAVSARKSTHRLTKHPLYMVRVNMIRRCYQKQNHNYINYGAKGVSVCKEWKEDFVKFYNWAISNGWQKGLQIDRINNNGNYEPKNCRIVTAKENTRNKRNGWYVEYDGKKKLLIEWCELFNRKYHLVRGRMYAGWDFKNAMDL